MQGTSLGMKRTRLVLPPRLLDEVVRQSGKKTLAAAVVFALREFVRRARARQILQLRGSGAWSGDLGEMRGGARSRRRKLP